MHNNGTIDKILFLVEGENLIELRAVDNLGNERIHTIRVMLDTVAPELIITLPASSFLRTNIPDLMVKGSVNEDAVQVTVNDEPVRIAEGDFTTVVRFAEDGLHEFSIVATDRAGNNAIFDITVDLSRVPPPLDITFEPSTAVITNSKGILRIHGTTGLIGSKVTIAHVSSNGADHFTIQLEENTTFIFQITLTEGENSIVVTILDVYGNSYITTPYTVTFEPFPGDGGLDQRMVSGNIIAVIVLVVVVLVVVGAMWLKHRGTQRG
jgi:hypothetical protein